MQSADSASESLQTLNTFQLDVTAVTGRLIGCVCHVISSSRMCA